MINNMLLNNSSKIHFAFIPDGGRRWAEQKGCSNYDSYQLSMKKLLSFIQYLFETDVDIISVYFSSIYNFKRTNDEINCFCKVQSKFIDNDLATYVKNKSINVKVFGNINQIPNYLFESVKNIEKTTKNYSEKQVYLYINYSSLEEISKCKLESIGNSLAEPVNVLIRSGGANVLSDFLLLQNAFSRIYFLKKLFNDIELDDIMNIYQEYKSLMLKYGE